MHPYQCFTKIRERQSGGTDVTTLRRDIIIYYLLSMASLLIS